MLGDLPKLLSLVLAFSLVSCTVAPAFVFAQEDVVTISNVARASISTGGQDGQNGADGRDGRDGEDGTAGTSGRAGVSVSNYASGETGEVITIRSITQGDGEMESVVDFAKSEETVATSVHTAPETAVSATDEDQQQTLTALFAELKLIIFTYVSHLF